MNALRYISAVLGIGCLVVGIMAVATVPGGQVVLVGQPLIIAGAILIAGVLISSAIVSSRGKD